jgi:hypothetical protein
VVGRCFYPVTSASSTINIDCDYVAEILWSVDLNVHIPTKQGYNMIGDIMRRYNG